MKESLGDLIKGYEANYNITLPKRCPLIIRLDMRAGHSFTKGFDKPYDSIFIKSMYETMHYLCKNIPGCQFGYVESDEISLLIYETNPEAEPWFANRVQKFCSISASMQLYSSTVYSSNMLITLKALIRTAEATVILN
jgi:tRNA(His) 5'-end guanylyltransferase